MANAPVLSAIVRPALPKGVEYLEKRSCYRASVWANGKRITKCFATAEEAIGFRLAGQQQIADGTMVMPGAVTVEQMGQTWLVMHRKTLRSYDNDRSRWSNHIHAHPIARMPIDAVEERHIEKWLADLEKKGLAVRSRKNCRTVLSRFFVFCKRQHLCVRNPCDDVKVTGELPPITEDWYLTPPEQKALIDAMPEPECWMVAFAIATGLRRGELFALHLHDVHLEDGHPYVMIKFGGWAKGGKLKSPKNKKTRKVALVGFAEHALRRWLEALDVYTPKNPHGLVFPHRTGARRVYSRDLPESFKVAAKKVTRIRVWWHLLRHTCASSLVAGWWGKAWSLEEVSKFLGHSSISVTERYAHLAPSRLDEKARETQGSPLTSLTKTLSNVAKLHDKGGSRPGDLKYGAEAVFSVDQRFRERCVSALERLADRDQLAVTMMAELLGEIVHAPSERVAPRKVVPGA